MRASPPEARSARDESTDKPVGVFCFASAGGAASATTASPAAAASRNASLIRRGRLPGTARFYAGALSSDSQR